MDTVKRPVGRPRKYPIDENKIKRPIGRPRKTEEEKTSRCRKDRNYYKRKKRRKQEVIDNKLMDETDNILNKIMEIKFY